MPTRVLTLTAFILLAAYMPTNIKLESVPDNLSAEAEPTPSPMPGPWPNLDTLAKPLCSIDGAATPGSDKAQINRLMNRYHLPEKPFEVLPLEYLQGNDLPQGEISPEGQLVNLPNTQDPNNQRAITVVGFVKDVRIMGCGAKKIYVYPERPESPGVQSANCHANQINLCTAQIMVTPDPALPRKQGRNIYFVKVTRRSRWLLREGYLSSNVSKDWSLETLRTKLRNHKVRFSGWLLFNENYRDRAWVSDPENKIGTDNDRQTAWEIHPVMGIEVLPNPSQPRGQRRFRSR
jgi:hypothetical protein